MIPVHLAPSGLLLTRGVRWTKSFFPPVAVRVIRRNYNIIIPVRLQRDRRRWAVVTRARQRYAAAAVRNRTD